MGLRDTIRGFFSGSQSNSPVESQVNEESKKAILADRIVDLLQKINKMNSFDSSLWSLSHATTYDLRRKSLDELTKLKANLEQRLLELENQNKKGNPKMTAVEESKWTGQKPQGTSDHDFNYFQQGDDYRG